MAKSYSDLLELTQSKINDGSAKNPLTVTVSSQNQGGFQSKICAREHTLTADQPFGFRGTNRGFKPSELLLAALAACQEVTWRLYAESMGIEINSISIELHGTQDLRGFMGLDETIPAGFIKIDGDVKIESPASPESLKELQRIVDAHCPILDDLTRVVPVNLNLTSEPVS